MIIKSITYHQFKGDSKFWELKNLELGKINLIVGKNGSGKSKTIALIQGLSTIIGEYTKLPYVDGYYNVTFEEDTTVFEYRLAYSKSTITEEKLKIDSKIYLTRNKDGKGKIESKLAGSIDFKIPPDEIKINRRDEIQYPYLEKLNFWAKHLRRFLFNTPMGKNNLGVINKLGNVDLDFNLKETEKIIDTFNRGKKKYK